MHLYFILHYVIHNFQFIHDSFGFNELTLIFLFDEDITRQGLTRSRLFVELVY